MIIINKHIWAKLCEGAELIWGVRLTCMHVQMQVHVLSKEWDEKVVSEMHMMPHSGTNFCATIQRGGTYMGSQVDVHACTDVGAYSNQRVEPEDYQYFQVFN